MTAACLTVGGLIFVFVLILTTNYHKSYPEMTDEEQEQYQQQILDAIDPQRIEDRRKEKLMNDYEYYLLTGELPPTE